MAAFHHLNDQLFMPAKWLKNLPVHPDELTVEDVSDRTMVRDPEGFMRPRTPEEALWSRKEDEAIKSGVYRSVMREGIVNPVRLETSGQNPMIKDGFHRVASVEDTTFVPITYSDEGPRRSGLPEHSHRENEERPNGR